MKKGMNFHQNIKIEDEPTVENAMLAALVRYIQVADDRMHDWKYGSIKWGICTANGYQRCYADAVAAIIRYYQGDVPELFEIDPVALKSIGEYLRGLNQ